MKTFKISKDFKHPMELTGAVVAVIVTGIALIIAAFADFVYGESISVLHSNLITICIIFANITGLGCYWMCRGICRSIQTLTAVLKVLGVELIVSIYPVYAFTAGAPKVTVFIAGLITGLVITIGTFVLVSISKKAAIKIYGYWYVFPFMEGEQHENI